MRCTTGGYGERGASARSSNSRSRHRLDSTTMSPVGVSEPNGPWKSMSWMLAGTVKPGPAPPWSAWRRVPTASISSMKTMHWPPHLRASFFAFRARKRTTMASMPMKVAAKPDPGIETKGELKPVALALATGALEGLAGLPERDDAPDLFLCLVLPADVVELHAPLGVARFEASNLRDVHHEQGAEEDQEVGDEEEEDEDELDPERRLAGQIDDPVGEPGDRAEPCSAAEEPDDGHEHGGDDAEAPPEAPEPGSPTVDHVLLAQLLAVGAEEAWPGNRALEDQIDQAAEGDDREEDAHERPPDV